MLVVHRQEQRWEDRTFRELPEFLHPGDCLVLNDSKVFPSRLFGKRPNHDGQVEVFLLGPSAEDPLVWESLVRPGKKLPIGESIIFDDELRAEVVARGEFGQRTLRLRPTTDLFATLQRIGHVPLPPYIRRADTAADRDRYQTIFARESGSVAAPTAGLHFAPEILVACGERGATIAYVTLHVGLGTFQPLHDDVLERVKLHRETYRITPENANKIAAAKRVVGVGTTSVRSIESAAQLGRSEGRTDLFIYPGFEFQRTGAMLTNFHLPQSSLLILVCALGGTDLILDAYRHAVKAGYRFYSYGDCMLIL